MKQSVRIGLFGGTFSPPHNGHVSAVKEMLRLVPLDIMYIMPAGSPPHKTVEGNISPALRLEMAKAAFENIDRRICVSDYEIGRSGASYTSETLKYLKTLHPNGKVFLFCGTDMFLSLPEWHEADYIFSAAHLVCVMRDCRVSEVEAAAKEYESRRCAAVTVIKEKPYELSSAEVRRAVKSGAPPERFVPEGVAAIIEREGLYR